MEKTLQDRLNELINERAKLVDYYNNLLRQAQDVFLRINQVQGAIDELNNLISNQQSEQKQENVDIGENKTI